MKKVVPQHGEVWLARLDPTEGREQQGTRPVVVISGDATNDILGLSVVVPLTSAVRVFPNRVRVSKSKQNSLDVDSDALPYQVRTLAHARFSKKLGVVTSQQSREILRVFIEVCTM